MWGGAEEVSFVDMLEHREAAMAMAGFDKLRKLTQTASNMSGLIPAATTNTQRRAL